jgi:hypothetical protein
VLNREDAPVMAEPADLNEIADDVIGEIWSDPRMYVPVYRSDIRSEAQADATPGLPLMYIWNEMVENGMLRGYSFSVNGSAVGALLEKRLPRSHPAFARVRDSIMEVIRTSQGKVVMESCIEAQQRPSWLYGQQG